MHAVVCVIGWLRPIYWATFSPAFCGSSSSIFCGHGGCLLPRLRACRKGQHREAYGEGIAGMLTIIKASLLGRQRMCTAHDAEPELARLSRLRKRQIKGVLGSQQVYARLRLRHLWYWYFSLRLS